MVDLARIRRLNDALVKECQRYNVTEALGALATTAAAALATLPPGDRDKALQAYVAAILNAMKQIDSRSDPLAAGALVN